MRAQSLFTSMFLLAGVTMQGGSALAASAIQSENCPNGLCASFTGTTAIPVIKSYSFTMPSGGGAAAVTFSGSLFCAASGTPLQDRVIDLSSAISTTGSGGIPATTAGYPRHAHVLKDEPDHVFDPSTSFNLQSTRVLTYGSAGTKTVYFRIAQARLDPGVTCYVYGGSFSVIRTP